jgi:multisubunit Na+/H+ antiporter MnhC subunit
MFEMIGLFFAVALLGAISALLGSLFGLFAWLLVRGRAKAKRVIFAFAFMPPASAAYIVLVAVVCAIFVPNQPDEFFGDFSEPLPHGYVLTGLGKMPDWSYIDSLDKSRPQPQMPGKVGKLEEDGEMVYGAYSHLGNQWDPNDQFPNGPFYFAFDTVSGEVTNFKTMQQLNEYAGHTVQLKESQFFRSQLPQRILLRKTENAIYFWPPIAATLLGFLFLFRFRFKGVRLTSVSSGDTLNP